MKKSLLLCAALIAVSASAQQMTLHPNVIFSHASEDGRYFVGDDEGTAILYDAEQMLYYIYDGESNDAYYTAGFGSIFSNDGVMVGNIKDEVPGYLQNFEWNMLPCLESDMESGKFNSADAITLDGTRICGGVAGAAYSYDATEPMLLPVIWNKQADGTWGMYEKLPRPEKDFSGRTPQYITARAMSTDGKTIVGQIVDYSGFYPLPIVYKQNEAGEWSYQVFGQEYIYNTNIEFPTYPSVEPTIPSADPYLDAEGRQAYIDAWTAYSDSIDNYWYSDGEYPSYKPKAEDFMTPENALAYGELYAAYEAAVEAYNDSINAFNDLFDDPTVIYGNNFVFNNIMISADGKYCATALLNIDEENYDPFDSWGSGFFYNVVRFDLSNNFAAEKSDNTDVLVCNLMADGTVLMAGPASEMSRQTKLMAPNSTADISLIDYLNAKSELAVEMMTDSLTFSTIGYDPETWEEVINDPEVQTGTACSNNNGTLFYGWMANSFVEDNEWYYLSYTLDLNKEANGINVVRSNNVTSVVVTDLAGNTICNAGAADFHMSHLNKGVYLITTTAADGSKQTLKIIRQ